MVEEHTRRTVHLRHDDALGPVDEEGAVLRHQGHVAHVNVLLLDIEHRTRVGFAVDFKDDQAQRDLPRPRIGDTALSAFVDEIGRAACRERVCKYVEISEAAESFKKQASTKKSQTN